MIGHHRLGSVYELLKDEFIVTIKITGELLRVDAKDFEYSEISFIIYANLWLSG